MSSPWEEEAAPLRHTLLVGITLRSICWGWPALESLVHLCRPLFVPARCDPEFIQEGLYRLSIGINPYSAGAARAPPLLLFLYTKIMPSTSHVSPVTSTVKTLLSKPLPLGWQAVLWPRAIALLADLAGAVLVYGIAEAHISTDALRLRANRAAAIVRKQQQKSQPSQQAPLTSEEQFSAGQDNSLSRKSSSSSSSSSLSDHGMTPHQVPGVAALLYMCHPAAVAAGCCGSTEPLISLATLLAIRLAYCSAISRKVWAVLATGFAAGVAVYLDPMAVIYLPAIALIAALPKEQITTPQLFKALPPLPRPIVVLALFFAAASAWAMLVVASAAFLGAPASFESRADDSSIRHHNDIDTNEFSSPLLGLPLAWNWLSPVYGAVLGGQLTYERPSVSLQWYLDAIGFVRFRTYFRWLGSALLPALVIPLLIRLGSLPHPAAALPSSPNKRRCSFSRAPAASATETKANQSSLPPHAPSCGGLVVISSLACLAASGALGASDLSLRAHAFALSLWACHLNLIATSHHNNAISSPSSQRTTERKDENEEVRKESEETEGKEEVFLFPFPWPPPLHGVLTIGMALTGAGIVTMWRMWLRGNGNANYLYFQSLVFAGFQGALGCGLLIAAVKRHDQTRDGERCAQVALVCCARRWLKSRHRRQRQTSSTE